MKGIVASMALSATTGEKATQEGSIVVGFSNHFPFSKSTRGLGDHVHVPELLSADRSLWRHALAPRASPRERVS